jgi:hypothetical protein
VLVAALAPGVQMVWHGCAIPRLSSLEPVPLAERLPRLALVIAARNDEATIRRRARPERNGA